MENNDEVVHVDDSVDPIRDLETIQHELCQKDLIWWQKAMDDEELAVRKNPKNKLSPAFLAVMDKVKAALESNNGIHGLEWTDPEVAIIREKLRNLITQKPVVYLVNLSAAHFVKKKNKWLMKIFNWIKEHGGGPMIPFSVEWEEEYRGMKDNPAAQEAWANEQGAKSTMPKIIKQGYDHLCLQQFFTAGDKEVRAWTVMKGRTAPQAAGVIHNDFERGFIKADICSWADFEEFQIPAGKGMGEVKAKGKVRQQGKEYIMQDGDIVHFHFNVSDKGGKKK